MASSSGVDEAVHPVLAHYRDADARFDAVQDSALWSMTKDEVRETITRIRRRQARDAAVEALLLTTADASGFLVEDAATSPAGWLRTLTTVTARDARRTEKLADALDSGSHKPVATALTAGDLLVDQAEVIIAAVDALPADLGADLRAEAEQHLVALADDHDAKELKHLGRHLLEVVAPDVAEAELAKTLAEEEERAARKTTLLLFDDGNGSCHLKGVVPSLNGATLRTYLHALLNPGRPEPLQREDGSGGRRVTSELLGEAFVQLLERYPAENLPVTSGVTATVVITTTMETLEGRLTAAQITGTDLELSPEATRRLACAAGAIPAVLNGRSQLLDLGRRSRLATAAQRLALTLRQNGTCGIDRCTRPTTWCDAHHWRQPWAHGGRTDLDDLVLICPRHHTLAHRTGHAVEPINPGTGTGTGTGPRGRFRIIRRT